MEDAAGFFANVFGGERFAEYVSGYCFQYHRCLNACRSEKSPS